ncbi:MAG TPA: hypothetical protein VE127_11980, partial [Solirubrobacteraceae bacterium]|nr:hypothetical protein [Solirubrobacteraceae bacterium]
VTPAFGAEQPAQAWAYIQDSTVTAAGTLTLTAGTTATLSATVGNDATSAAAAFYGANAMSAAAVLSSNKVSTSTRAFINNTDPSSGHLTVGAGSTALLTATDAPSISAQTHVGSAASAKNDLGSGLVNNLFNEFLNAYQYTSDSGTQALNFGDRVRLSDNLMADGFTGNGTAGQVYQYMGTTSPIDLGAADYTNLDYWKPLNDTNFVPQSVINAARKAFKLGGGTTKSYYVLIDRNDVRGDAQAYTYGVDLTSAGAIALTASETATIRATDGSTVTAGTKGIGGVMVTNQVQSQAESFASQSSLTTTGSSAAATVEATNAASVTADAEAAAKANDAVGLVIAFNTVGWKADNVLFQAIDALLGSDYLTQENPVAALAYLLDTPVSLTGDLAVSATNAATVSAQTGNEQSSQPTNTFVLEAKNGVQGMSAGGLLASNKASGTAQAYIENDTATVDTVGGALTVQATNNSTVESTSKLEVSTVTTNNLDAVKQILQELIPSSYDYTTESGAQTLANGDRVRSGTGAIYEYVGSAGPVTLSPATDFTTSDWHLLAGGASDDPTSLFPNLGNLTDSGARSYGIAFVVNDARGSAIAYIGSTTVDAASVSVLARENATIAAEAEDNVNAQGGSSINGKGTVLAAGGEAVTNIVLSNADAHISNSSLNGLTGTGATGAVSVAAEDTSRIDATLLSSFSSAGNALGLMLAFNSIGWKPSNILFNAIDAILGDPLISQAFNGEQPANTVAYLKNTTVDAASIGISATAAELVNSTVSNAATSMSSALYGASGMSIGIIVASNKVDSTTDAYATNGSLTATGGAITIAATDQAGIFTNDKLVSSSITTSDGGASVIQSELDNFVPADFSTDNAPGSTPISFGQTVRIGANYDTPDYTSDQVVPTLTNGQLVALADDFGTARLTSSSGRRLVMKGDNVTVSDGYAGGGTPGQTYQYVGDSGLLDLGAQDYTSSDWVSIGGTPGTVYQYVGSATLSTVDLNAQDYTDTNNWVAKGG